MKLLCFGDSNTYGYDPRSYFGSQYAPQNRWVDLLAKKMGCKAVNAGENGREIPKKEWELQRFDLMLSNQKPLDLLLVMLGGNDLLQGNSVETVAARMESFLARIPITQDKIVLIGPPLMRPGTWVTDSRLLDNCERLNASYHSIAQKLGIHFIDASMWDIEVTFDGVHYTEKGHQSFAEQLWLQLKKLK